MATKIEVTTLLAGMDFDTLFALSAPSAAKVKASTKKDTAPSIPATVLAILAQDDYLGRVVAISDPSPSHPNSWAKRGSALANDIQKDTPYWLGYVDASKGLLILVRTPYRDVMSNLPARQWAKTRENWRKSEQDASDRPHMDDASIAYYAGKSADADLVSDAS